MTEMLKPVEQLKGRLVVSCQARPGNPVKGPRFMSAFARAAELGGTCQVESTGAGGTTIRARLPISG